jgi:hypothetical protein
LIEEFYKYSLKKYWMYSVEMFLQISSENAKSEISEEVFKEIREISSESISEVYESKHSLYVKQEVEINDQNNKAGIITIVLNKEMNYATGTGKFFPSFDCIPALSIDLLDAPYNDKSEFSITYGCGTQKNFSVHIKPKNGLLKPGDYIFSYKALKD